VIARFEREHPALRVQVIDNDSRTIPAGLNRAIAASQGEIILRLDGHSRPAADYVEKSVLALQAGLGANVGGVWKILPGAQTWVARAIAAAASHPLGVGDALYRHGKQAAVVDTVPFGAWKRSLTEEIGGFDESLLSNEDYEFNARIRQSGRKIWFDPAIESEYFARANLKELARQYWRYGFWKWKMLRRYPATLRWRQALPPLFVLSLAGWAGLGLVAPLFWGALGGQVLVYLGLLSLAALKTARQRQDAWLVLGLPLAIAVMHLAWGSGFLWSSLGFKKV
jgi:hypothetical protein